MAGNKDGNDNEVIEEGPLKLGEAEGTETAAVAAGGSSPTVPSMSQAAMVWGVVALVFAIWICTVNNAQQVVRAGVFAKLVAIAVGAAFGWAGALIGDALRRFAHPDSVFTTGGFFRLIWIKLFWMLGPQVIGLVLGGLLGCSLVLS